MADIANDIRLAVDSGKAALGINSVIDSIKNDTAKLLVVASKNRGDNVQDITHMAKISNIKVVIFEGTSMELGAVCGKPFSVSAVSIIEQGNSKILEDNK
jgi:large subunit ribosomal protein L30e